MQCQCKGENEKCFRCFGSGEYDQEQSRSLAKLPIYFPALAQTKALPEIKAQLGRLREATAPQKGAPKNDPPPCQHS